MRCSENCRCQSAVIALVFVPGIMGSRLKNTESGEIIWDPMPGAELNLDALSNEDKERRQKELHDTKTAAADDNHTIKITKWFKNRIVKTKNKLEKLEKSSKSTNYISKTIADINTFLSVESKQEEKSKEEKIEWQDKIGRELDNAKNKVKRELRIDELQKIVDKFAGQVDGITKDINKVSEIFKTAESVADKVTDYHREAHRFVSLGSSIWRFLRSGPVRRKQLLVSGKTTKPCFELKRDLLTVDSGDNKYFKLATSVIPSLVEEKRAKGWGEVTWGFYGGFLHYLEKQGRELSQQHPGVNFPVFAIGYNWMLSNRDAGERIKQRLAEFKQYILKSDGRKLEEKNIKFIFITHSMGGFASRAAFLLSEIESEVSAVIHGAMPINGSADSYVRMRKGQPGGSKLVIGKNASDMTATLGFSEGGLELLPNQFYTTTGDKKKEWLFLKNKASNDGNVPLVKDYSETNCDKSIYQFYCNTKVWYRLITLKLLAPEIKNKEDFSSQEGNYDTALIKRLCGCYEFHEDLKQKGNFHGSTSLIYVKTENKSLLKPWMAIKGKKERKGTYTRVVWMGKGQPDGSVDSWKDVRNEDKAILFGSGSIELVSQTKIPCDENVHQNLKVLDDKPLESAIGKVITDGTIQCNANVKSDIWGKGNKRFKFTIDKARDEGDGTVHLGANENETETVPKERIDSDLDHMKTFEDTNVRKRARAIIDECAKIIYNKIGK